MRLVLATLLLVVPALVGLAGSATTDDCGVFPDVGEACRVEGGYTIRDADGRTLFTHGPDPVPTGSFATDALAPLRDPPCIDELAFDHRHQIVYAHPVDKPNRGAQLTPMLRDLAAEANGLLYSEGALFGAPVEYPFLCDLDGQVTVSVVTLPLPSGTAQYTQLVAALRAMGFDDVHTKYWVWIDDRTSCGCAGIAAAPLDASRTPMNSANGGPLFGANYGYNAFVGMHENGHNLGAVNGQAPDQSGGAHCNDGRDVMCYADGGSNSSYRNDVCVGYSRFDCDHDTYFHPDPPADSFVARRWQLAAPVNRFVQGCLLAEGLAPPMVGAEVAIPPACAGHVYAIYGADPLAATGLVFGNSVANLNVNEFTLCWFAGEVQLACPANDQLWGHEGRVPAGADRAVVAWKDGPDFRYTLSVI